MSPSMLRHDISRRFIIIIFYFLTLGRYVPEGDYYYYYFNTLGSIDPEG